MQFLSFLNNPQLVASKCRHKTRRNGTIDAFGKNVQVRLPKDVKCPEYCLECIGKLSIRCAWCEAPIVIGNPVTLYTPASSDFQVPSHAVIYQQNPLQLVGCLGWNCAETGADRAGFWVIGSDGKGMVERVMSPLEQVMSGRSAVIVSDLGDRSEATKF